jgi:hypothetical protein
MKIHEIEQILKEAKTKETPGILWRVEQSRATGRYHVIKGYGDNVKVWQNKIGAIDFRNKEQAEQKADELNKDIREASDISGLLAASYLNKSFIVTAKTSEGVTKKYRVKAQSERVAKEKFMKHHSMAQILDIKEEPMKEDTVIEEKDSCYHKVKSRYKVWPSAYASGALVKCRKVGAKNWGKSKK